MPRLDGGLPDAPGFSPMITHTRFSVRAVLFTGLALGFSFPPYPFPFLAWAALVPLLDRVDRAPSAATLLLEATAAFLLAFGVAFYWPLLHAFPQTALASAGGLVALPVVMALPFGLARLVRRRLGRSAGLTALVAGYLVMEGALSRGPFAFPWPLLGHTQAEALGFTGFVAWTGVPGVTLWLLTLNVAALTLTRATTIRKGLLPALAVAALLAGPRMVSPTLPTPTAHLRVGVIQPALPPTAWADVSDAARVDTLLALTETLPADPLPRLILWPETALPVFDDSAATGRLYRRLQRWVDDHRAALLTGAVTRASPGPGGRTRYHNSALLFRQGAEGPVAYHKVHPVPFAEHVPFLDVLPMLEALTVPAGGVSGYVPGRAVAPLPLPPAHPGVMICLESLFGTQGRDLVAGGARLLVALTQDGWWGPTPGYRQHLAFNRFRARETGRVLVQASVSGLSALLLPDGTAIRLGGWMERSARTVDVPLYAGATFYVRHGDLVTGLALIVSGILAVLYLLAPRRRRGPRPLVVS